ncbi:hypothetical protein TARUN_3672 [Trichoderma arundinaceum]|uniref:Uncharacterized protein n=1 Tax=Trichoderma arundinaceum TaxID=490622 RepID=A0A395NR59_TRIAR|nr:hypothetical protein TARUN_3672 [Trichoderma arundinaceum]
MPSLWRAASWWKQSQNRSLSTLLMKFGRSEATEPRDLIYALRGMSSDVRNTNILVPDYEKPEEYIVGDVVQFIFHCDMEQLNWALPKSIRDLLNNFRNFSINVFCDLIMKSLSYYMKMQLKDPKFVVSQDMVKTVALQNTTGEVAAVFRQLSGVESEPEPKTDDYDEGLDHAARNLIGAREMFAALAGYQGDVLAITDQILIAAAENPKYADRTKDLLHYNITAIAAAAAMNERGKQKLFWTLLRRQCYYESVVRQFLKQLLTGKEWRKWEQYAVSRIKRLMRGKDRRIWDIISTSAGIEITLPGA